MDLEAISTALAATREGLSVANFSLALAEHEGRLVLTVAAQEGACHECLVPKSLFLQMVRDEIVEGGQRVAAIDVVYPADRKAEQRS
jgi:hypothetical protein